MKVRMALPIIVVAAASSLLTLAVVRQSPAARATSPEAGAKAEATPEPLKIAGLKLANVETGVGWDELKLTGKVAIPPEQVAHIGPRTEGRVVSVRVTVGDSVRAGQVVAEVASVPLAEARAQQRHAKAKLSAAQQAHDQEERLVGLGGIAERPLEEARAESGAAQAELNETKSATAEAQAELARAEAELSQCAARLTRARDLYSDTLLSKQDLESAEAEHKRDQSTVSAAKARLDTIASRAAAARAKSEIASRSLAREEKIHKERSLDQRALLTVRTALIEARIEARAADERVAVLGGDPSGRLDTIPVTAPISGRVIARNTNLGAMVKPEDRLFEIADLSSVLVEADIYERDLAKIHVGQSANVHVDARPNEPFRASVKSISDVIASETRTAHVRFMVPNAAAALRPGMFASIGIITGRRGATLFVPRTSVLDDAGSKVVFIPCNECDEDKKAGTNVCGAYDRLPVKLGESRGERVEVTSGLEPGCKVVVEGQYQIRAAMSSGKLAAGCADH